VTASAESEAPRRRVVITGVGVVCSLGRTTGDLWQAIEDGRSGIGPITRFDASDYETRIAAEVPDVDQRDERFDSQYWSQLDLRSRFAVSSALSAVQGAGLTFSPQNRAQVAVVIASERPLEELLLEGARLLAAGDIQAAAQLLSPHARPHTPADRVAALLGISGPVIQIENRAAGGLDAIIEAAAMIRRGDALVAVAGGAEAPITPLTLAAFQGIGVLSTNNDNPAGASRPLDTARDGFVLGEGAAIVTLEALEVAEARGVKILAELEGEGMSFSPGSGGTPDMDEQQIGYAIQLALATSGRIRSEIDVLALHAAGSIEGDRIEVRGVKRVFGAATRHHMYTPALKGHTGHLLSASGPLTVAVLLEAMHRDKIPPTLNLVDEDPEIDLDANSAGVRDDNVLVCIANATGWAHNAALVLAHPRAMRPFEPPEDSGGALPIPEQPI
jgi:3-oxoacyl-[acyl-carrier-protein] synthase II